MENRAIAETRNPYLRTLKQEPNNKRTKAVVCLDACGEQGSKPQGGPFSGPQKALRKKTLDNRAVFLVISE
jgi:hypothetical protein